MGSLIYDNFKLAALKNQVADLSSAGTTVKVMLVTSTYTSLSDATKQGHVFKSDIDAISGAEATGTGYTAGGSALASKAVTLNTGTHIVNCTAADLTWASSTITATGAIAYIDTGTAGTSRLIRHMDFGGSKSSTAGNFTISWPADGWLADA